MDILKQIQSILQNISNIINCKLDSVKWQFHNNKINQLQLFYQYQSLYMQGVEVDWRNAGFSVFSQTDEDGILLYIYSKIGFTNRLLVDIGCGIPKGSNSANLICNWGFHGLLVEGNDSAISRTINFYNNNFDTKIFPPDIVTHFVTVENINQLIEANNIRGDIDLMLLDIDGIDYWLWEKLEVIRPRVVVLEACSYLGKEEALVVPYSSDFNRFDKHPDYMGASIPAYIKLAKSKGYRLVACNKFGFNLFFAREDEAAGKLNEITVDDCFYFEPYELKMKRLKRKNEVIKFEWIKV